MRAQPDHQPERCRQCGSVLDAADQSAAREHIPAEPTLVSSVDAAVRSGSAMPITMVTLVLFITGTAVVLGQRSMTGALVGLLCLILVAIAWKHRLSRPRV